MAASTLKKVVGGAFGHSGYLAGQRLWWKLRNALPGTWYEQEMVLLEALVSKGDRVVDIGVNMCQYTSRLAKLVGDSGIVLGFEPSPETFVMARRMMRGRRNVELHNLAVSRTPGEVLMADLYDEGLRLHGWATVVEDRGRFESVCNTEHKYFYARSTSLDAFFEGLVGDVSFLKCDAQGHECAIVSGGEAFLRRFKPSLLIEILSRPDFDRISGSLVGAGYRPYHFRSRHLRSADYDRKETNNYFFLP
jgi:FkbM family methyltransferase